MNLRLQANKTDSGQFKQKKKIIKKSTGRCWIVSITWETYLTIKIREAKNLPKWIKNGEPLALFYKFHNYFIKSDKHW